MAVKHNKRRFVRRVYDFWDLFIMMANLISTFSWPFLWGFCVGEELVYIC